MDGNAQYCPSCGAQTGAPGVGSRRGPAGQNGSPDAAKDASDNKTMAILAYIGFLVFIPIFAAKESPFARYHSNQGLVLFIIELVYGIVAGIISTATLFSGLGAYFVVSTVLGLVWILFLVLSILGIVNAVKGEIKPLPVIGGIRILK